MSGVQYTLRPYTMADYSAVLRLWEEAGPGLQIRPSDERDEVAKKLERDPDLFWVAEMDGLVAGVIMGAWDGRRGWLHHLAVASGFRRQGIAKALIHQVEQRLAAKGCLKINLLVRRANAQARALYGDLGYDEMDDILPMGKEL